MALASFITIIGIMIAAGVSACQHHAGFPAVVLFGLALGGIILGVKAARAQVDIEPLHFL